MNRVSGVIMSLFNVRDLERHCAKSVDETLLVPVLIYGSETMLWKKERSRIRTVQMENLRGLLGIRRMDRVLNARITELCGVTKGQDEGERVDEGVLRWFGHVERMEKNRIAKSVYVEMCW